MRAAALVLGAYLLGSVSFGYMVVRRLTGGDVRRLGSGNPGATNVLRTSGVAPGLVVLVLDAGKGAAAVAAALAARAAGPVVGAVTVAVVVGHVLPLYHHFRGGKGVATAAGALAVVAPAPTLVSLALFAALVAATGYVAVGSVAAVALFPAAAALHGALAGAPPPAWLYAASAAIALVVAGRHRANFRRLWRGEEERWRRRQRPEAGR